MEVFWGCECLRDKKSASSFHCMCGCVWVDAWQCRYVCARLSQDMTGICKCKHLGAGNRKEYELTIVKALAILVRYSLQHSGEVGWLQVQCSNAFSREATVISFISLCDCSPMSNISAPQLDPWSFLHSLCTPVHLPPPFLNACPSDHGCSWLMVTSTRPASNELLLGSEPREFWLVSLKWYSAFYSTTATWKIADFKSER